FFFQAEDGIRDLYVTGVQTCALPISALAALCRRHGARLLVDPSISSAWNLDVLPHADVVVSSLTKYTASEGDLTAGVAAINPARSEERRVGKAGCSRSLAVYSNESLT